jgi:hypothetical protein
MLIALPAFCQNDSGIFLSVRCGKGSHRHISVINHIQVCLANSPFILTSEFVSVTEIESKGDAIWFDLTISSKGVKQISQIVESLPTTNFAFVIDKDVFSVLPASDLKANRTFRFKGEEINYYAFSDTQKKLKALIAANTKNLK